MDTEGELHLGLEATDEFLATQFSGDVSAEITKAEMSSPALAEPPD